MSSTPVSPVQAQYERWPYPYVPLLARVHREQLWQINFNWLSSKCGLGLGDKNPRIWVTGCGTFQPYVFASANPGAQLVASDLSHRSLELAERRCRFHGYKNVEFRRVDLQDSSQYPDGQFDLIECYGVLMSLRDPQQTIRDLAAKLKPGGVLRLMVYPHYSRQRIFQIQRLAKLLGLHHDHPKHPKTLKALMDSLPRAHPLRYAFSIYYDSGNPQGIVDGFLHASDRGFTPIQFLRMADRAGLRPAFYFHRPWGQPGEMGKKLGIEKNGDAFVLHYLDLWQELRTNLIVCFVKKDATAKTPITTGKHPLFDAENPGLRWRDRFRLKRMSFTGAELSTRTHEKPLKLKGSDMRSLLRGHAESLSPLHREILPGYAAVESTGTIPHLDLPDPPVHFVPRLGKFAPNPLFAHLFDAYTLAEDWNEKLSQPLPSLQDQINTWKKESEPLEFDLIPFGLTPMGTLAQIKIPLKEIQTKQVSTFEASALIDESVKLSELKTLLAKHPGLPQKDFTPAELRQLWVLLCSHRELFLTWEA